MTVATRRLTAIAAGCAAVLLAASAAQAFTFENQGPAGDAAARFDQDRKFTGSGNNAGTYKQGNTTIQFGGRPGSVNQQYNSDRMFDPAARLNSER